MKVVKNFSGRRANLSLLSGRVESFFKLMNFKTSKIQTEEGYIIIAKKSMHEKLYVKIVGSPNEFLVELSTGESSDTLIRLGTLTSLFGGGTLFLRGMKSRELLAKIEGDFWRCVEEAL